MHHGIALGYPTLPLGYPTPTPLLTSDGHHWRYVQSCSLEDLNPTNPPLPLVLTSNGDHQSMRYAYYWNVFFCFTFFRTFHDSDEVETVEIKKEKGKLHFFKLQWNGFLHEMKSFQIAWNEILFKLHEMKSFQIAWNGILFKLHGMESYSNCME